MIEQDIAVETHIPVRVQMGVMGISQVTYSTVANLFWFESKLGLLYWYEVGVKDYDPPRIRRNESAKQSTLKLKLFPPPIPN